MKLIALTLEAFGPFANKEHIDFTPLYDAGLFLIHGPTGAGKTTIFDGICYALFGQSHGNERVSEQLRSLWASKETLTKVTLTFQLHQKEYTIERIPPQETPKKRGVGMTMTKAEAVLYEETLTTTGINDVNKRIEALLGLDVNQFRQLMMVPQGQFRKLLTADSKEREAILKTLFDTSMYGQLQAKFKEEARSIEKSIEKQLDALTIYLEKLSSDRDIKSVEDAVLYEEELKKDVSSLDAKLAEAKKDHDQADQVKRQWDKVKQAKEELAQARDELKLLEGEKDDIRSKRQILSRAERANSILPIVTQLDKAQESLSAMKVEIVKEEDVEKSLEKEISSLLVDINEYEQSHNDEWFEGKEQAIARLKKDQLLHRDLLQLETSIRKKEEQVIALDEEIQRIHQALLDCEDPTEALHESDQNGEQLNSERQALNDIKILVDRNEQKKDELALLQGKSDTLKQRLSSEGDELLLLQTGFDAIEDERKKNIAGQLALALEENQPCPVCGSKDHPSIQDVIDIDEDKYQRLEGQLLAKKNDVNALQLQVNHTEGRIKELSSSIDQGMKTKEDVEKQQLELDDAILLQRKKTESLRKKHLEHVKLSEQEKHAKHQKQDIALEIIDHKKRINDLRKSIIIPSEGFSLAISVLDQDVKDARQHMLGHEHTMTLKKEKQTFTKRQLAKYAEEFEKLNELVSEKNLELMTQIELMKFETVEAVRNHALSHSTLLELREHIESYDRKSIAIKERIKASEDVASISFEQSEEEIITGLTQASDLVTRYQLEFGALSANYERVSKDVKSVTNLDSEIADIRKRFQVIGHLADFADGKNEKRLSFERFVQATYLEDVLLRANDRLKHMSGDRYQLFRRELGQTRRQQGGLELDVFDAYTQALRHVKTLSGGEGFMASLALALGLSDVIREYAGGIEMETLLIDEGFGTLDSQSLDDALDILVDVQKHGRLIGIISHVEGLKQRIEAKIEVIKSVEGSSIKVKL